MARSKDPLSRIEETARRIDETARRIDEDPRLIAAVRKARELIPGSGRSKAAQTKPGADFLTRFLREDERRTTSKELGRTALEVFNAISESRARSKGEQELAILFTDIVGFSSWALQAGDGDAVQLLREVEGTVEPAIKQHHGSVVKRLGDGCMAVFTDADDAVLAALEAQAHVPSITVAGYTPEIRAGIHLGRPRKQSGDYLGVDVNVAARVADAATGGQVLVSDTVRKEVETKRVRFRKRGELKAKGAPEDLVVHSAKLR